MIPVSVCLYTLHFPQRYYNMENYPKCLQKIICSYENQYILCYLAFSALGKENVAGNVVAKSAKSNVLKCRLTKESGKVLAKGDCFKNQNDLVNARKRFVSKIV